MKFGFFLILLLSAARPAFAGGEGNGGNSVVCFGIPLQKAIGSIGMTKEGRSHITSAVSLEYYLASLRKSHSFLDSISKPTIPPAGAVDEIRKSIFDRLQNAPTFRDEVYVAWNDLGEIENGVKSNLGVVSLKDYSMPVNLPTNCAVIQTVIRQNDQFFYDGSILGRYDYVNKALIKLHETIYYLGVKKAKQESSTPTTNIILSILNDDFNPYSTMIETLLANGFGKYSNLASTFIRMQTLLDAINGVMKRCETKNKEEIGGYAATLTDPMWDKMIDDERWYPWLIAGFEIAHQFNFWCSFPDKYPLLSMTQLKMYQDHFEKNLKEKNLNGWGMIGDGSFEYARSYWLDTRKRQAQ